MDTLTIKLLTETERKRARRILRIVTDIKNRHISALNLSFFLNLILTGGIILIDFFLLKQGLPLLKALGFPLNYPAIVFLFLIIWIIFSCVFSIPLYYGIFLPRAPPGA